MKGCYEGLFRKGVLREGYEGVLRVGYERMCYWRGCFEGVYARIS